MYNHSIENQCKERDLEEELKILADIAKKESLMQAENFIRCALTQVWIKDIPIS
jgi:hypothetical protein